MSVDATSVRKRILLIEHMLQALQMPSKELTKWEEGFLATVTDQWERTKNLSMTQYEKLEQIYAEKTD